MNLMINGIDILCENGDDARKLISEKNFKPEPSLDMPRWFGFRGHFRQGERFTMPPGVVLIF